MKNIHILFLLLSISSFAQLQWLPLENAPTNTGGRRFDDVFFISETMGWAANGSRGAVYKTVDAGLTWTLQMSNATNGTNYYFRNVEFLDENIGFIGTLDGVFFKTSNGGTTWTAVTNFPTDPVAICGLDTVGTSTVYGVGAYYEPAFLIKSSDSGATWSYTDMSAYANGLVEVLFIDENIGFCSGIKSNGGVILKTINGGTTWTEIYNTNIAGEYVWKLQILPGTNNNTIFGSVEAVTPNLGKLIKTFDGGTTWTSKNFPDVDVQAVGFVSATKGWMGGHHTGFYETLDGGNTWTNISVGSNLNRIFFLSPTLAYASGTTIYKFSDSNLSNANFEEKERVPLVVKITPNPVVDKLNFSIEFLGNDHIKIELYDNLGRRLKELQKEVIPEAITKNYSFDFPYASGTYILNFHNDTGRQSVKFVKK
jgi:photosystem II stability/assembly factor-like uncharacterized protein